MNFETLQFNKYMYLPPQLLQGNFCKSCKDYYYRTVCVILSTQYIGLKLNYCEWIFKLLLRLLCENDFLRLHIPLIVEA